MDKESKGEIGSLLMSVVYAPEEREINVRDTKSLKISLPTPNIYSGIKLKTKCKMMNKVKNLFSINISFYMISQSGNHN